MLESMNVLDAGLLAMESPETPMHVGGIQILRLPRGAGPDYVSRQRDRVLRFPADGAPFNYRLAHRGRVPGIPAWEVLDRVDLGEHVFHHGLPWPGSEKQLFDLVARLNTGPLDRSRPLWEHHLIEGLEGGRYATFTRIHHSLMDGMRGMRLARATTSTNARARNLPPYWAVRFDEPEAGLQQKSGARPRPTWWRRQGPGLDDGIETLAELRKAFGRLVESYRHTTDGGLVPFYRAPDCMLNGKVTPRRALAVVRPDMARIERLSRAQDATVNEIVLTLCGSALRRYLLEREALPARPVIASMMIATARTQGDAGGNAIVPAMVSLATHLEDPRQRFEAIRGSSRHAKELIRELPSQAALTIFTGVAGLPYVAASLAGRADKAHAHNLVISNVPGPREKRYINGALIEAEFPLSVLVPGQGMNITVISRAGRLDVAVLVCPDLAPEPGRVGNLVLEALDELEAAFARGSQSAAGRGRAGRKAAGPRGRPALPIAAVRSRRRASPGRARR